MHSMSWIAQKIESGWDGCVRTRKGYGVMTAANVKCIAIAQGIDLIVDRDGTLSSDVKNPKLAALGKRCRAELIGARKFQGLGQRYRGTNDGAIQVDIDKLDGAGSKEVFEEKARTQLFGRHSRISDFIGEFKNSHGVAFDCELLKHV